MSTERLDAPGQRVLAASADPDVAVEVCEAGGPFAISWFGQFVDPNIDSTRRWLASYWIVDGSCPLGYRCCISL